jgi:5-methylcytosine-specific restriction protein A
MKKPKLYSSAKSGAKKFKPKRLYDTPEWTEFRNKFLAVNTICYACGERSRAVDHIIPFKKDVKLFWNTTNYMPLCFKCHNTITANFDRFVPPLTKEKLIWVNDKRLETATSIKIKVLDIKNTEFFIDDRDLES